MINTVINDKMTQTQQDRREEFSTKVNILKALAITLVVSGHLEFSLL